MVIVCVCVNVFVCMYGVCACMYMCVCACMHLCICAEEGKNDLGIIFSLHFASF